ncbi:protein N-terminal asparagine amidohydrolase-like isoform X2 [Tachypleus tridentatus]|uniref:protein N-terminal asparagine amidohydrolase-like isoform X2 n=1 Tax=Tachypleus tridentatus TaxID=6853 RepID=UPI003FD35B7C
MPILVNDEVLQWPLSSRVIFKRYPWFKSSSKQLVSQQPKIVEEKQLLYVCQREFAVVSPQDKFISILGTDDSTTCNMVALRHTGSGVVALGHFDGSLVQEGVSSMVTEVKCMSSSSPSDGKLELHMVGGFLDDKGYSEQLVLQILDTFNSLAHNINLITCCVCGINIKSGELYPASFPDRGPAISLRSSRHFTRCDKDGMVCIYQSTSGFLVIGPFNYRPVPEIDFWLAQSDQFLQTNMSTSPSVEPPHFAQEVRNTLTFIKEHPFPLLSVFSNNQPHLYKKNDEGVWIQVYSCDKL